jgi:hypothetical protein
MLRRKFKATQIAVAIGIIVCLIQSVGRQVYADDTTALETKMRAWCDAKAKCAQQSEECLKAAGPIDRTRPVPPTALKEYRQRQSACFSQYAGYCNSPAVMYPPPEGRGHTYNCATHRLDDRHDGGACESQANQCHSCSNGRASRSPVSGSCFYDNVADCRSAVLKFCKENQSSGQALNVKGGKLTNDQVQELMLSCPNIPHGSIPYSGSPPATGSKKMQQCQAFEKSYFACNLTFRGFDKKVTDDRGKCLRETYAGP